MAVAAGSSAAPLMAFHINQADPRKSASVERLRTPPKEISSVSKVSYEYTKIDFRGILARLRGHFAAAYPCNIKNSGKPPVLGKPAAF